MLLVDNSHHASLPQTQGDNQMPLGEATGALRLAYT